MWARKLSPAGWSGVRIWSVYSEQARREFVGACCSVYVTECSESNSWVRVVFAKCCVVLKQGKICKIDRDRNRTITYNGMYFWPYCSMYFSLWSTWMDSWPATGIGTIANYDTDWWDKKTRISEVRKWHMYRTYCSLRMGVLNADMW